MTAKKHARIWNWEDHTKVGATFNVNGTPEIPIQIKKHFSREIQKAIVFTVWKLRDEAVEFGILFDTNDDGGDWYYSTKELEKVYLAERDEE